LLGGLASATLRYPGSVLAALSAITVLLVLYTRHLQMRTDLSDLVGTGTPEARVLREFMQEFANRHGSVNCTDLLGYNLGKPEEYMKERDLYRKAGKVWISYGVPFIVPITAGLLSALLFGDFIFGLLQVFAGG
jgi:hypothetical protein